MYKGWLLVKEKFQDSYETNRLVEEFKQQEIEVKVINPNEIDKMNKVAEFNNATHGVFELGSLFKSLSGAIALDTKILTEETIYDARKPIKEGKFTIHDYKPKKRKLKFCFC